MAARNTSRVRHPRGTTGVHNRAGYGKGTDGGTKTIGGVRQSGIAPHKKSIGSLIKAHFQYNAINTIIIFIIIFSNLFFVLIDVNSSSNVTSLPKISSEGQKWKMCGSVQKFELTTGKEFNRRSHISHNMEHLRAPQSIQEHFWALIKPFERMQQANYKRAPLYTFG